MYKSIVLVGVLLPLRLSAQEESLATSLEQFSEDLYDLQVLIESTGNSGRMNLEMGGSAFLIPSDTALWGGLLVEGRNEEIEVYSGADEATQVIFTGETGDTWNVVDKAGEWYAIDFNPDEESIQTGWVHSSDVAPISVGWFQDISQRAIDGAASLAEDTFKAITTKLNEIKIKYENDPHIYISGFSVQIGTPPSININVEFR